MGKELEHIGESTISGWLLWGVRRWFHQPWLFSHPAIGIRVGDWGIYSPIKTTDPCLYIYIYIYRYDIYIYIYMYTHCAAHLGKTRIHLQFYMHANIHTYIYINIHKCCYIYNYMYIYIYNYIFIIIQMCVCVRALLVLSLLLHILTWHMQHVLHIVYMHNIISPATAAPRLLGKILRGLNIARIRKGTIEARTLLLGHWFSPRWPTIPTGTCFEQSNFPIPRVESPSWKLVCKPIRLSYLP